MKLLLIEDEKELSKSIREFLGSESYIIDTSYNFEDGLYMSGMYGYDCAIVDLMLPGGTGFDLVKEIKKQQPECGIIIITARNTLDDKLSGLDLGADDYLTKPFHLAELAARIRSVIRRRKFSGSNQLILNEITIDLTGREVSVSGKVLDLTRREYDILLFFVGNQEKVLIKEAIVEHVWGDDSSAFDNFDFVYTHIKNLRKKLKEAGAADYISSVYGVGYRFSLS